MTINVSIYVCSAVAEFGRLYYNDEYRAARIVESHLDAAVSAAGHSLNSTLGGDRSYVAQKSDIYAELDHLDTNWFPSQPDESTDSNLMLLSGEPDGAAGLADIGGNAALLKWSEDICSHTITADRYATPSDTENRIRGAIHEIGHNFGMYHADGLRYTNWEGTTYSTPHGCEVSGTLQSENNCGEPCSQSSIDEWDHYYDDDCAALKI